MNDDLRIARSQLRVLRSRISMAATDDPSVRSILSEFSSRMGNDDRRDFVAACRAAGMIGPDPSKLAARMGAIAIIDGLCRGCGMSPPGVDPIDQELMRLPEDPGPERR